MKRVKRERYVYEMVLAAMFSVIIAICAWITIPFAVPFTMQTFGVFLAIAVLGGKLATVSIGLYILLGIVGIPVFSGFQSGIGVLFQQTGGYVIGFFVASLVSWGLECGVRTLFRRGRFSKRFLIGLELFFGLLVCYAFGTLWFWRLYMKQSGAISLGAVLGICVVPFVVPDLIKIGLVLVVQKRLRGMIK